MDRRRLERADADESGREQVDDSVDGDVEHAVSSPEHAVPPFAEEGPQEDLDRDEVVRRQAQPATNADI